MYAELRGRADWREMIGEKKGFFLLGHFVQSAQFSSDQSPDPVNSVCCLVCPNSSFLCMELGGLSRKLHHR